MGYFKILMRDKDNPKREYNAYVPGFDKNEAIQAVRYELLDDEKDDEIFAITEIPEEEYLKGYKEFGEGFRKRE